MIETFEDNILNLFTKGVMDIDVTHLSYVIKNHGLDIYSAKPELFAQNFSKETHLHSNKIAEKQWEVNDWDNIVVNAFNCLDTIYDKDSNETYDKDYFSKRKELFIDNVLNISEPLNLSLDTIELLLWGTETFSYEIDFRYSSLGFLNREYENLEPLRHYFSNRSDRFNTNHATPAYQKLVRLELADFSPVKFDVDYCIKSCLNISDTHNYHPWLLKLLIQEGSKNKTNELKVDYIMKNQYVKDEVFADELIDLGFCVPSKPSKFKDKWAELNGYGLLGYASYVDKEDMMYYLSLMEEDSMFAYALMAVISSNNFIMDVYAKYPEEVNSFSNFLKLDNPQLEEGFKLYHEYQNLFSIYNTQEQENYIGRLNRYLSSKLNVVSEDISLSFAIPMLEIMV